MRADVSRAFLIAIVCWMLCCAACVFAQSERDNPWVKGRPAPDHGLVPECRLPAKHYGFLGVAADPDGRTFFLVENCVYTVSDLGIIRVLGGEHTPYTPKHPRALLVDADDNLTVLDANGLTRVYPDGQTYSLLSGAADVTGIALDDNGNTFYSSGKHHQVWMLEWDGKATLIAGDGQDGMTGDGQLAREARLHDPSSLAIDHDGNVYIVDGTVVRIVDANGMISTLVGNAYGGIDGDGIPAGYAASPIFSIAVDGAQNVYLAEPECIRVVDHGGYVRLYMGHGPYGHLDDNHLGAAIQLRSPVSLSISGDLMVFADLGTQLVRRVGADGYITTIAGNQGLYDPLEASHER